MSKTQLQKDYQFWRNQISKYNYRARQSGKKEIKQAKRTTHPSQRDISRMKTKLARALGSPSKAVPPSSKQTPQIKWLDILKYKLQQFYKSHDTGGVDEWIDYKLKRIETEVDISLSEQIAPELWAEKINKGWFELNKEMTEFLDSEQTDSATPRGRQSNRAWLAIMKILHQDNSITVMENVYISKEYGVRYE